MYLILFTIIYCVAMMIFNLDHILAFAIYLTGAGFIKGVFSKELRDVFNLRKISLIYKNVGLKNSLIELVSLMLVFISFLFTNYKSFAILQYISIILVLILVYRFLFWGIRLTLKKFLIEISSR